jgi:hypothetical protein
MAKLRSANQFIAQELAAAATIKKRRVAIPTGELRRFNGSLAVKAASGRKSL